MFHFLSFLQNTHHIAVGQLVRQAYSLRAVLGAPTLSRGKGRGMMMRAGWGRLRGWNYTYPDKRHFEVIDQAAVDGLTLCRDKGGKGEGDQNRGQGAHKHTPTAAQHTASRTVL